MAPHGLFQKLTGKDGSVRIEALGALIGQMGHWTLTRRGDDGPKEGLYDLRAVFSYINPHLWADDDYEKVVELQLGKRRFRLEEDPEFPARLEGSSLLMQCVRLTGNGEDAEEDR